MTDNLNRSFTDPGVIPSDELISALVGSRMKLWQAVIKYASENNKDVTGGWNYYRDGKQWLFKFAQKKKTIFWAGIMDNNFSITFYFGDKAEPVIENSDLPFRIKDGFKNARRFGSIRPITIILLEQSDAEDVYKLINLKVSLK